MSYSILHYIALLKYIIVYYSIVYYTIMYFTVYKIMPNRRRLIGTAYLSVVVPSVSAVFRLPFWNYALSVCILYYMIIQYVFRYTISVHI